MNYVEIDFTKSCPTINTTYAGEKGEIDAVNLKVIPEEEMMSNTSVTSFFLLFATAEGTESSRSYSKAEAPFICALWEDVTNQNVVEFQLLGQNSAGSVVMKSPIVQLYIGESIDDSTIVTPGTSRDTLLNRITEMEEEIDEFEERWEDATATTTTLSENESATVSIVAEDTVTFNFGIPKGKTGTSISSIVKTSTVGLVDTYTITFSNGTTTTFTVTNGAQGQKGDKGDTGAKGDKGDKGDEGEKGDTGEKGDKGDTGAKGDKGDTGDTGATGNGIASTVLNADYTLTITFTNGTTYTTPSIRGAMGDTGNGISSVAKTGTSGLIDTYTITYTDGTTSTFTVTNGKGINNIAKTSTSGLVDTYTITFNDGTTSTYNVTNGEQGATGNGISSVAKTSTSGLVDTYTITFTDGTTTTFNITNGEDGTITSVNGKSEAHVVLDADDIAYDTNNSVEDVLTTHSQEIVNIRSGFGDTVYSDGIILEATISTMQTRQYDLFVAPKVNSTIILKNLSDIRGIIGGIKTDGTNWDSSYVIDAYGTYTISIPYNLKSIGLYPYNTGELKLFAYGGTYTYKKALIESPINTYISDLYKKTKLLLEDNSLTFNGVGYVGMDGKINNNQSAQNTGYVICKDYDSVTADVNLSSNALAIAFYDVNKTFISGVEGGGASTHYQSAIPSSACFVVVSNYGTGTKSATLNAGANSINPRVESLETNAIKNADLTTYVPTNGNLFDKTKVTIGKELYGDGNFRNESNSAISDYIYVHGLDTLFINNMPIYQGGVNYRYSAFYDENKTYLGSIIYINNDASQTSISVPSNAYYFVFSVYQRRTSGSSDYNTLMLSTGGYKEYVDFKKYISKIKSYNIPIEEGEREKLPTKNKKMIIFGDSITETATISDDGTSYVEGTRTNWMTFAKVMMNTTDFKNYAKSGATWKDTQGGAYRQNLSEQITMAMADSNNDGAKIIVVSIGTNDGNSLLGSYETAMSKATLNDLDRTNLYEALRWAMWTLRTKYTQAKFFVGLPIQRASGEQPNDLLEAITKMAHRYNFIVIDATNKSGIVRDFETVDVQGRYLYDGLHPNASGSTVLAKLYSNVIIRSHLEE